MRSSLLSLVVGAALAVACSTTATTPTDGATDTATPTDSSADVSTADGAPDTQPIDVVAAAPPIDAGFDVAADAPSDGGSTDVRPDTGPADSGARDAVTTDSAQADSGSSDVVIADSGGGPCSPGCGVGLHCCGASCMNLENDPLNCGSCGHVCPASMPMCLAGTCSVQTCSPMCGAGYTCCAVNGPGPSRPPTCYPGPTCPVGCPACL